LYVLIIGLDTGASLWQQRALGLATWGLLLWLLRGEDRRVRAQVAVVVAFATCIEYTFSPLLHVYVYRLGNVPAFVPPGHGLMYLAALALGRSELFAALRRPLVWGTLVVGGGWAFAGVFLLPRQDVAGAIFFVCLARFLLVGRAPLIYAAAFLACTYLELVGTRLGTWTWQPVDPMTGLFSIGNPPSGIPGGYCFFDAAALAAAPWLLVRIDAVSALLARARRPAGAEPIESPAQA
jgi:hypothetical protein